MNRVASRAFAAAFALTFLSACGSGLEPTRSEPQGLHVEGNYQITKTGVDDTCGGPLTPVTVAGTVTHAAGGSRLVIRDGFSAFSGSINADGTFTIAASNTTPHDGAPVVTTFEQGRFSSGVFTARVTLAVDGPSAPQPFAACRVVQTWLGVRNS